MSNDLIQQLEDYKQLRLKMIDAGLKPADLAPLQKAVANLVVPKKVELTEEQKSFIEQQAIRLADPEFDAMMTVAEQAVAGKLSPKSIESPAPLEGPRSRQSATDVADSIHNWYCGQRKDKQPKKVSQVNQSERTSIENARKPFQTDY